MVPLPHVALAMTRDELSSQIVTVFGDRVRVTHARSRRELVRVLARHRDVAAVISIYGLPDGAPLDVIRRFTRTRIERSAIVFLPHSVSKCVLNEVAFHGGSQLILDEDGSAPAAVLRSAKKSLLRTHYARMLIDDVTDAQARLSKTIRRWRRRLGLSPLDGKFLSVRAHGLSPESVFGERGAWRYEQDLVVRVDASSVWEMVDRLHDESFANVRDGRDVV